MSFDRQIQLSCDAPWCQPAPIYAGTVADARTKAKANGWLVALPGGKDLCPKHHTASERKANQ